MDFPESMAESLHRTEAGKGWMPGACACMRARVCAWKLKDCGAPRACAACQ